jgi:hypothetical protein
MNPENIDDDQLQASTLETDADDSEGGFEAEFERVAAARLSPDGGGKEDSVSNPQSGDTAFDAEPADDIASAPALGTEEPPAEERADNGSSQPDVQALVDKRVNDVKSELGRQIAELKRQLQAQPVQRPQAQPQPVVQEPDKPAIDLAAIREDYPDLGGLVDLVEQLTGEVGALRQPVNQMAVTQQAQRFQQEFSVYTNQHPDYELYNGASEKADPEKLAAFNDWSLSQPKAVQDMINRTNDAATFDGNEAAWLLERFKRDTGIGQEPAAPVQQKQPLTDIRQRQREAVKAVPAGARTAALSEPADEDFEGMFEKVARARRQHI